MSRDGVSATAQEPTTNRPPAHPAGVQHRHPENLLTPLEERPQARVVEFPVAQSAGRAAYIAGTFDTKGREFFYLRSCLAMIHPREVARHHPKGERAAFTGDPGSAVSEMALVRASTPLIDSWAAARGVNPDMLVLCHGGPIATPEDARVILKACKGCNGFYGASSMERLPIEAGLTETTRKIKAIGGAK